MRDEVFISYSHKDTSFLEELLAHLTPYVRTGSVTKWSDPQIPPGSRWFDEIQGALARTRVAVLLVSKDFLASEFIRKHELEPLLKEAESGAVTILWVPIRACGYEVTPLKNYQAVSPPERPFAKMGAERDAAWVRVCQTIQRSLSAGTQAASPSPPKIAAPKLFCGSNQGPETLVGREQELSDLDAAWKGANKKNVVTIVAWGGMGKTSLVAHWAAMKLAPEDKGGIERYFDWSFYSQGTRREGDPTGAVKAATADLFVAEALKFFGDEVLATSNAGARQKGERLAHLVGQHHTLLILDGLEPLQDAKTGELRDTAVRALLHGLAAYNPGLCLVTTRQSLPELNRWHATTAPEWPLARLSAVAGAELLECIGVLGTPAERERLAADVKGHALTLALLGKYLAEAHDGDISQRAVVELKEADYEETSGHAFRVMDAYKRWFEENGRHVELAILRLLGLFDRPATPDCLAALHQLCGSFLFFCEHFMPQQVGRAWRYGRPSGR